MTPPFNLLDSAFRILEIIGFLGGIAIAIVVTKIWLRQQTQLGVSKAKDEVITLLNAELDAQRLHAERCDREVAHYREEMHTVRNGANDQVLKAQADVEVVKTAAKAVEIENAALRARTDLSPVMDTMHGFIKEQTKINTEVLAGMQKIGSYFERINGLLVPALEKVKA